MPRIDKLIKLSDDIALVHLAGRNLNQVIVDRRKPCCFDVKDYIGRIAQLHVHFIVDDGHPVFYNIGLHTVNQLDTSFLGSLVAMGKALHISMVGNGDSLVAPLGCRCNDFLYLRQGVHRRHIGMGVKFNPLLPLRHEVLALIVGNFLHILHIHGQIAGEIVHLHISPHAQPGAFFNHVKLLGFFFIFHPFLQGKAGSIVCHLEVEQDPACPSDLLLQVKDHSLENQTVFLSLNFDHRSNLCLVQIWLCCSLASLEVIGWLFLWRWCHLLQGFHGF